MFPSKGLQTALNAMHQMSVDNGSIYHKFVPLVSDTSTISEISVPILDTQNLNVLNDFVGLLKKVVYTAVNNKVFNNPLAQLEGERLPLGNFIENTYVNPAEGTGYDPSDFAGLLEKYSSEVAVEYLHVSTDVQFKVTLSRDKIRNAFTSWSNLEEMISGLINSLYNGAYIRRYRATKAIVSGALAGNNVQYKVISNPTDEQSAKAMIRELRSAYSKFQLPSTQYNAWNKVKGGRMALETWSNPEDIIVMISADVEALVDTEVLASAFNMSKTDFMGRVFVIDDFSVYNKDGSVAVDGSNIKAFICDRSWFKLKTQDFALDEFFNANVRAWTYFLNDTRMENFSLFANALCLTTSAPTVNATDVEAGESAVTVTAGEKVLVPFELTPPNATSTVTVSSSASTYADATIKGKNVEIEGKAEGSATITITANGHTDTIAVTVEASA